MGLVAGVGAGTTPSDTQASLRRLGAANSGGALVFLVRMGTRGWRVAVGGGERKLWREGAGCTRQRPGVSGKHQFYLMEVSGASSGETGSGEAFSWPPWV